MTRGKKSKFRVQSRLLHQAASRNHDSPTYICQIISMNFIQNLGLSDQNINWIYLLGLLTISFVVYFPLAKLIHQLQNILRTKQTHFFSVAVLGQHIEKPLTGLILTMIWQSFFVVLEFPVTFEKAAAILLQIFQAFFMIRLSYLICEAVGLWLERSTAGSADHLHQHLVPLVRKSLKVLVVLLGTLILIQSLGFNVVSLLAGLGLGGLALALAAQDTAANVFGSIMILLDRPFKVGDLIRIGDTEGVVEEIGFRSTRIRTFYRSVVTLPNSFVAKEKIDNLSHRDSLRVRHTLGVTYSTSIEQITQLTDDIKRDLTLNPLVLKDDIRVNFSQMGDFSLQIQIQFFVTLMLPMDLADFEQDLLLQIMKLAKNRQVEFAFPTQTLMIESLPKAASIGV